MPIGIVGDVPSLTEGATGTTRFRGAIEIGDSTTDNIDLRTTGAASFAAASFAIGTSGLMSAANGSFTVGASGAMSAGNGSFVVASNGLVSAANASFRVGASGAVSAATGSFVINSDGLMSAANGSFSVGASGAIAAANGAFDVNSDGRISDIDYFTRSLAAQNAGTFALSHSDITTNSIPIVVPYVISDGALNIIGVQASSIHMSNTASEATNLSFNIVLLN